MLNVLRSGVAVAMGSGSSERYTFTVSEAQLLREFACWGCCNLYFCVKCGGFHCHLGYDVPRKACSHFKYDAEFIQSEGGGFG